MSDARPADPRAAGAIVVEPVRPGDVPQVWTLVRAFARYTRLEPALTGSPGRLAAHLFEGAWPPVGAHVARAGDAIVGYAIWFGMFSSFATAPVLFLEDLYVTESQRGTGAGIALFRAVAAEAVRRGCPRLEWAVLDWNAGAIAFYERVGAVREDATHDWHLGRDRLEALAAPQA